LAGAKPGGKKGGSKRRKGGATVSLSLPSAAGSQVKSYEATAPLNTPKDTPPPSMSSPSVGAEAAQHGASLPLTPSRTTSAASADSSLSAPADEATALLSTPTASTDQKGEESGGGGGSAARAPSSTEHVLPSESYATTQVAAPPAGKPPMPQKPAAHTAALDTASLFPSTWAPGTASTTMRWLEGLAHDAAGQPPSGAQLSDLSHVKIDLVVLRIEGLAQIHLDRRLV